MDEKEILAWDKFAGHALEETIAREGASPDPESAARWAASYADALLAQRRQRTEPARVAEAQRIKDQEPPPQPQPAPFSGGF